MILYKSVGGCPSDLLSSPEKTILRHKDETTVSIYSHSKTTIVHRNSEGIQRTYY